MSGAADIVVETERLVLRKLCFDDAAFVLKLVNEPSWLRYIGDKGVRTLEDARQYIRSGPMQMYETLGYGLYLAVLRDSREPIGICGLLTRPSLGEVELGFALLPAFWGRGLAVEAARGTVQHARRVLGLTRIAAITSPDNEASARLLAKLGFRSEGLKRLEPNGEEIRLYRGQFTQLPP